MYVDEQTLKRNLSLSSRKDDKEPLDKTEESERAFKKIERLLAYRDRATDEIRQKLKKDQYSSAAIEQALDRAKRCGYLDDARFAALYIRSRLHAGKGINGIIRDLKRWGIDAYQLDGFPESYLEESGSQLNNAIGLLMRKPPHSNHQRQAAYNKLIRAGYSSQVAYKAVLKWLDITNSDQMD